MRILASLVGSSFSARLVALWLGQFGHRVHPGGFQQVGVLRADAVDPHEVGVVDPLEMSLGDRPLFSAMLPAGRGPTDLKEFEQNPGDGDALRLLPCSG